VRRYFAHDGVSGQYFIVRCGASPYFGRAEAMVTLYPYASVTGDSFWNQETNAAGRGFSSALPHQQEESAMEDPVNDNEPRSSFVFIIIGKAYEEGDEEGVDIHVMLQAPDDDTAVREALNALTEEGFHEADLDQIGTIMGEPDEEPHASAYQGALEGEVAIIRFN
jgi:hypothetical protein